MNEFLAEAELQKFWIVVGFALGSAITGSLWLIAEAFL